MRTYRLTVLVCGLLLAAGCSDEPLPLEPVPPASQEDEAPDTVTAPPADGVGTFGIIDEIKPQGQGLVLYQTGLDFEPAEGVRNNGARHELSVGARHQKLQVQIRDSTEIWIGGEKVPVDSLDVGMHVLVVGRVTGAALHADEITDLADAGPPPENPDASVALWTRATDAATPVGVTSMCMGQTLPPATGNVLSFQGCWGGPSASDHVNTGFIPVFCPIIGCFGIDRLNYTAALAGWGYAFPFRFEATPPTDLVYHVPGPVDLKITPLSVGDAFSFWGGLGLEFGIGFRWCGIFGCYDLGMKYLSVFTTAQHSNEGAPLTGQLLDIATTSCPSVGLIPIEGIPINPLEIGFCQDLDLEGSSFDSYVYADGAEQPWLGFMEFGPDPIRSTVRPMTMDVGVRWNSFDWAPDLRQGLFFRFRSFTVKLFDTPAIPLGSGPWHAIHSQYPMGFPWTLATDPESPIDNLRYFTHPTATRATLEVDPAPTLLGITSGLALAEGTPVTAWLREEYMDAAIAGEPVVFNVTGLNGTASSTVTALTDAAGIASLQLPPGEYAIAARYAGAETYLPSSASMAPVYVYMPTTFVVWGGNDGGLAVAGRYQFWGSGWTKQVTGGDYGGNPSFQGFAMPVSESWWVSPPASSAGMPGMVADVIRVIVTTEVSGRGSRSSGDIAGYALLRVDSPEEYRPAGGHRAWGVLRIFLD
ncbi:MAG: Ig-like domain-containing protein [Candidatus Longimicrobiales bacterium M2_2A_002]